MDEQFLSAEEFASQTGVSYSTVLRWIYAGYIFARKLRGRWAIPSDEQAPDFGRDRFERLELDEDDEEEDLEFDDELGDEDEEDPDEDGELEPEDIEEDNEDADGIPIHVPEDFLQPERRKLIATLTEAEEYQSEIPVPTELYRTPDGFYSVAVLYDMVKVR